MARQGIRLYSDDTSIAEQQAVIRSEISMRRTDDQGNAKEKSSLHLDRREFDQERRFSLPKKQPGRRTKMPVDQEDDSGTAEGT